jgi:hypothetical protein
MQVTRWIAGTVCLAALLTGCATTPSYGQVEPTGTAQQVAIRCTDEATTGTPCSLMARKQCAGDAHLQEIVSRVEIPVTDASSGRPAPIYDYSTVYRCQ